MRSVVIGGNVKKEKKSQRRRRGPVFKRGEAQKHAGSGKRWGNNEGEKGKAGLKRNKEGQEPGSLSSFN